MICLSGCFPRQMKRTPYRYLIIVQPVGVECNGCSLLASTKQDYFSASTDHPYCLLPYIWITGAFYRYVGSSSCCDFQHHLSTQALAGIYDFICSQLSC